MQTAVVKNTALFDFVDFFVTDSAVRLNDNFTGRTVNNRFRQGLAEQTPAPA